MLSLIYGVLATMPATFADSRLRACVAWLNVGEHLHHAQRVMRSGKTSHEVKSQAARAEGGGNARCSL